MMFLTYSTQDSDPYINVGTKTELYTASFALVDNTSLLANPVILPTTFFPALTLLSISPSIISTYIFKILNCNYCIPYLAFQTYFSSMESLSIRKMSQSSGLALRRVLYVCFCGGRLGSVISSRTISRST
jgi:hypothetical protein